MEREKKMSCTVVYTPAKMANEIIQLSLTLATTFVNISPHVCNYFQLINTEDLQDQADVFGHDIN